MRRFFSQLSAMMMVVMWPALTGSVATGAVITLSPGADGGVVLTANGTAGANQFFSSVATLFVTGNDVLGPDGGDFSSSAASGTLVVGSPFTVISVHLITSGTPDRIGFVLPSTAFGGNVEFQNVTASWSVNTLAFSSLTPGTYSTSFQDTTLEITDAPEPASMMLFLVAAGLAITRLPRRS